VIGNDEAINAYRAGKPFPEGTIIGRVAWKMVPSEENNKTFGQAQSFVPGDAPDWYLQFMEKNAEKYVATGGWGYSNFGKDLKPLTDEKMMYSCYTCHKAVEARDYIFTKYAPWPAKVALQFTRVTGALAHLILYEPFKDAAELAVRLNASVIGASPDTLDDKLFIGLRHRIAVSP
jgi:hypothetical protein